MYCVSLHQGQLIELHKLLEQKITQVQEDQFLSYYYQCTADQLQSMINKLEERSSSDRVSHLILLP